MTARAILPCLAMAMLSLTAHAGDSFASHGLELRRIFLLPDVPANYLDTPTAVKLPKTRAFKTVIPGLLYRGGGAGGRVPLTEEALKGLCEAGFSLAVYGYPRFSRHSTNSMYQQHFGPAEHARLHCRRGFRARVRTRRHEPDPHGGREPECRPRVRALLERRPCFGRTRVLRLTPILRMERPGRHGLLVTQPTWRGSDFTHWKIQTRSALGIAEEDRAVLCRQPR